LDELRSLAKPPDPIKHVLKSVMRMFGENESEWNAIKNFLKDRSVIDNILNFDPRSITQNIRRDVE
jgi:dynein heavy chain 1